MIDCNLWINKKYRYVFLLFFKHETSVHIVSTIKAQYYHGDVVFATLLNTVLNDVLRYLLCVEFFFAVVDWILVTELVPDTITGDDQKLVKGLKCILEYVWYRNKSRMSQTVISKSSCDGKHSTNSLLYN